MELQTISGTTSSPWWVDRDDIVTYLDSHWTFRFISPWILIFFILLASAFAFRYLLVYIDKALHLLHRVLVFLIAFAIVVIFVDIVFHLVFPSSLSAPEPPPSPQNYTYWEQAQWVDGYARKMVRGWFSPLIHG